MAFEYIGNAETIARQLLPWGIGLLGFGIGLLIFSQIKDKALAYNIASFALIAAGAYMLFQAKTLNQSSDDWHITANQQQIDWRSPDERIDQSFSIGLQDIAYIDKAATPSATDSRPVYRLLSCNSSPARGWKSKPQRNTENRWKSAIGNIEYHFVKNNPNQIQSSILTWYVGISFIYSLGLAD